MTIPGLCHTARGSIRLYETFPVQSFQETEKLKYLVNMLSFSGLSDIEVTVCNNRTYIQHHYRLMDQIAKFPKTRYWVASGDNCLIPAIGMGAKNLRQSHHIGSLLMLPNQKVLEKAAWRVNIIGAFYKESSYDHLLEACQKYQKLGAKVVISDTGQAEPAKVHTLLKSLFKDGISKDLIAMSFIGERVHEIQNIRAAFVMGVREFETSIVGSPSTYDLAASFEKLGYKTGINLERLGNIAAIAKKSEL